MDDPTLNPSPVRPAAAAAPRGTPAPSLLSEPLHDATTGPLAAVNEHLHRLHPPPPGGGAPARWSTTGGQARTRPDGAGESSVAALIKALDGLPAEPGLLGLDVTDVRQCRALLDYCALIAATLARDPMGRRWLYRRLRDRSGLLGLAPFNFQPALARLLDALAGRLQRPAGGGGSGLPSAHPGGDRPAPQTVLDLKALQAHPLYRALPERTRAAIRALRRVAGGPEPTSWEALAGYLLPALCREADGRHSLAFSLLVLLTQGSRTIGTALELQRDDHHVQCHRAWRRHPFLLQGAVQSRAQCLQGCAPVRDAPWQAREHSRSRALLTLYRKNLRRLLLAAPQRFTVVRPGALSRDPGARARALLAVLDRTEGSAVAASIGADKPTHPALRHWLEEGAEAPPLLMAGMALTNACANRGLLGDSTAERALGRQVIDSGWATLALWLARLCANHGARETGSPAWMVAGAAMATITGLGRERA
ncbi:hypothetical protein ACN2MM_00605 [Alkalilimnicola ehrlichii MLHE-1]|uniref:Uncharacterized protein n=1 Tax=Alkalilimnicola ehrlichii (strain ATCC BAA-1101 / DSM 17681 / MLHE-1) TaxID=187272 RepID=Q0ACP7_ALKEH|nr:hypothetical protein [Alkalilimnicola ehrlichii]ABI55390.1 hypothetical protein Mlg_0031 [Alkalilimnicola ehrlichii MLHE-1]